MQIEKSMKLSRIVIPDKYKHVSKIPYSSNKNKTFQFVDTKELITTNLSRKTNLFRDFCTT